MMSKVEKEKCALTEIYLFQYITNVTCEKE